MIERLVDTHIHVWNFDQAEYPWLKGDTSILNRTYDLAELEPQRIKAGVTTGILVQAANNPEDTNWMLETAKTQDWIKGIVGWLPLKDPQATARTLEQQYRPAGLLKGVRHLIHDERDPRWLLQDTVLESLGLLAAMDIPYDLVGILPAHIETALRVAEKWPALRMVFDHLNQPPIGRLDKDWQHLMITAAAHPNFYVKISGLGTAARKGHDWTAGDLEPCIEFALHYFGEDRCFCGGDWPVADLAGSYESTWTTYRTLIGKYLDQNGQAKLYHTNATRFYNLPI
ncbi:amidohydrolase family protein [Puia sp.]|jgi:L-fuconolactonase|uniref:amidohydrolase family protein n=1 Tax=Puia sp. TaxID=2045100 RepID=UPI002F42D030